MIKKVIGIISYLPDKEPDRELRIDRLNKLVFTLDSLFKDIPVIIISQNWKEYNIPSEKYLVFKYDRLGILQARKTLREKFLESDYDYLIMLDDDAIIEGNSSKKYLEQIDNNPDGVISFHPNVGHLNLFAISKKIYSETPMVEIDPEKDEGFEDTIFTTLVRSKYPNKYREFKETGLKEISFKYTGEGKVPSTWANVRIRDWIKLRKDTQDIKDKIMNKELLVDLVVPYVDGEDENWLKLYNKYAPESDDVQVTGKQRFRKSDNFKYFFRTAEKHLPWLNNIFLLVQQESQVPKWINRDKVKVVLHEEFIPHEYLPTFQSQSMEMFLDRIPELGERFIYANDDMYFVGDMKLEDFFVGDKVRTELSKKIIKQKDNIPLWQISIVNGGLLVNKEEAEQLFNNNQYISPVVHGFRPYIKSYMREVSELYEKEIRESITKFRAENNFNVYMYDVYTYKKGKILGRAYTNYYLHSSSSVGLLANIFVNTDKIKMVCINDTEEYWDEERDKKIGELFNKYYPQKSKYEV